MHYEQGIICAVYVDDTTFWSQDESKIDKTISELKSLSFELTDEEEFNSFLGIKIDKDGNGNITMTQRGLLYTIIKSVGLENYSKQHQTPAISPPLQKHEGSSDFDEVWSYRSLIGMLTYLARNTILDLEYDVHQCARFQCNPKKPHTNAIKRIVRYLLGTKDNGITFKPDGTVDHFECYVDVDFAGNYTQEVCEDPNSVKSRLGCVIKYAVCPIIWFSKLQTEITISTTEADT